MQALPNIALKSNVSPYLMQCQRESYRPKFSISTNGNRSNFRIMFAILQPNFADGAASVEIGLTSVVIAFSRLVALQILDRRKITYRHLRFNKLRTEAWSGRVGYPSTLSIPRISWK